MPNNNYTVDLSIYQLVLNRLLFLVDDPQNQTYIGAWIYEVMIELEVCYKIAKQVEPADFTRVGQETYYSPLQRQIIADVVALYVLYAIAIGRAGAGLTHAADATTQAGGSTTNGVLFVKKAKAGTAEAEFEQIKINETAYFALNATALEKIIKETINRKAILIGCPFDICNDCTINFLNPVLNGTAAPFIVVKKDCGCP